LKGSTGSGIVPPLVLGVYQYRIVDLAAHNRVLAQQQQQLRVFGQVAFATLLGNPGGGVYTSSSSAFPWVVRATWYEAEVGRSGTVFGIPTTNACRSAHVEYC
jgi:hypothetical protein